MEREMRDRNDGKEPGLVLVFGRSAGWWNVPQPELAK